MILNELIPTSYILIPLFIGLIILRVLPLTFKNYIGVYAILAAGNIAIGYMTSVNENYFYVPLIISIIGLLLILGAIGLRGKEISYTNYAALLFAIGLFPWTHHVLVSIFYVFAAFISVITTNIIKMNKAYNTLGVKRTKIKYLEKDLSKEDFEKFSKIASLVLPTPILIVIPLVLIVAVVI